MLKELFNKLKSKEKTTTTVKVDNITFTIHPYCYKKIEMTENMKFRIVCKENPEYNQEFDDINGMTEYIGQFIFSSVIDLMVRGDSSEY